MLLVVPCQKLVGQMRQAWRENWGVAATTMLLGLNLFRLGVGPFLALLDIIVRSSCCLRRSRRWRRDTKKPPFIRIEEAAAEQSAPPLLQLLRGYDATVAAILEELRACGAGDELVFSVYVCEPGKSSEAVLAELEAAAQRGATVRLRTDCSPMSAFTRACEGTATLVPRLRRLGACLPPGRLSFEPSAIPTHAKFLACRRASQDDAAIFGGINLGDRFRRWPDFAVRCAGRGAVEQLLAALDREVEAPRQEAPLHFVANRPTSWSYLAWGTRSEFAGTFEVVSSLERFFADPLLCSYRVAASYIDRAGADVLCLALQRGARVAIVLPRSPNVYGACNSRTLAWLLARWGESGRLDVRLHEEMVHAKAAVGTSAAGAGAGAGAASGGRGAVLGSCNLKHRSFAQFEELNAHITDEVFCAALWSALGALLGEAKRCTGPQQLAFSGVAAVCQEEFG